MFQAIHIIAINWVKFWTDTWVPHRTSAEELRGEGLVPERRVGRLQRVRSPARRGSEEWTGFSRPRRREEEGLACPSLSV